MMSETKLKVIDNVIVTEKGIQSFIHTFYKVFFEYSKAGRFGQ